MLNMSKILVLDYPSEFTFPPKGYGGIERWLWSFAKQSTILGHEVILSGPLWQSHHLPAAAHYNERIDQSTEVPFLEKYGKVDFLVGGHEYWANAELRNVFSRIADKSLTFQMMPNFDYGGVAFDNMRHYLFCFSKEMQSIYAQQTPNLALCAGEGINEDPQKSNDDNYLVWIGRLDEEKAPHLAVLAAEKLGLKIKIIGKPQFDDVYYDRYRDIFSKSCVEEMGILAGLEKMKIIAGASAAVYTCSQQWIESAGMIFAEYLRSGVPIAGLAWRRGTAAEHAITKETGSITFVSSDESESEIIDKLAHSIRECIKLDRNTVFEVGGRMFSPKYITKNMLEMITS